MKILIVGASGLVGGNCLRVFEGMRGWRVVGTHYNFATQETVYFDPLKPEENPLWHQHWDVIIHCGALTHVDRCESEPELSYRMTVGSTANLCNLAEHCGARMVYISTDYVFDGLRGPYRENDQPNPLSVYGKHKLAAEQLVRKLPKHLIIRITNVYGDEIRGKNFLARIVRRIAEGQPVELKAPVDQYATPVNASDVALAAALLIRDSHVGIFHLASTDYCNRAQLVERVISHFPQADIKLRRVTTAALGQTAPRPLNGGLLAGKFNALYPQFFWGNVDDYLNKQKIVQKKF
jgi:dTDP-4-dehydrorhamnose reductase